MFRITELESGRSIDVDVRDRVTEGFREQLDRGIKKPRNRKDFLGRVAYRIELAIWEALDPSLQPPKTTEETEAVFRAMMQNLSIPPEAFRRRTAMLKFLRENPRKFPYDDAPGPSDREQSAD